MTKRQDFLNGKLLFAREYLYSSSKLQRAETKTEDSHASTRFIYQYNSNQLPVTETEYHIRASDIDSLPPRQLTYKDKSLVGESFSGNSYPPKLTKITYSYDSLNRITTKNVTRDTLNRNTNFIYNGLYITSVFAKTNTWQSWAHDPMMRGVFPFTHMPVNYEIDFSYDDKGYLTHRVEKLNGVIRWSTLYIYTYY